MGNDWRGWLPNVANVGNIVALFDLLKISYSCTHRLNELLVSLPESLYDVCEFVRIGAILCSTNRNSFNELKSSERGLASELSRSDQMQREKKVITDLI